MVYLHTNLYQSYEKMTIRQLESIIFRIVKVNRAKSESTVPKWWPHDIQFSHPMVQNQTVNCKTWKKSLLQVLYCYYKSSSIIIKDHKINMDTKEKNEEPKEDSRSSKKISVLPRKPRKLNTSKVSSKSVVSEQKPNETTPNITKPNEENEENRLCIDESVLKQMLHKPVIVVEKMKEEQHNQYHKESFLRMLNLIHIDKIKPPVIQKSYKLRKSRPFQLPSALTKTKHANKKIKKTYNITKKQLIDLSCPMLCKIVKE